MLSGSEKYDQLLKSQIEQSTLTIYLILHNYNVIDLPQYKVIVEKLNSMTSITDIMQFKECFLKMENIINEDNVKIIFDILMSCQDVDAMQNMTKILEILHYYQLLDAEHITDNMENLINVSVDPTNVLDILIILKNCKLLNNNNAQEIFQRISELKDKDNFREALQILSESNLVEISNLEVLFQASNPLNLANFIINCNCYYNTNNHPKIFTRLLEGIINGSDIQDINQATKDLFKSFNDAHKQLLFLLCGALSNKGELDFDKFSSLVNTPIEQLKETYMEIIFEKFMPVLEKFNIASPSNKTALTNKIRYDDIISTIKFYDFLFDLMQGNIVTVDNAQIIFDVYMKYHNDLVSLGTIKDILQILADFNLLHAAQNTSKIQTLLNNYDSIYLGYMRGIFTILRNNRLLNENNVQDIFNKIIKLEDIAGFSQALDILNDSLTITPQRLNLLFNATDSRSLAELWSLFLIDNNIIKSLSISQKLQKFIDTVDNSCVTEETKQKFNNVSEEHKKIIADCCNIIQKTGILDFKILEMIINTPILQLQQLMAALNNSPDILAQKDMAEFSLSTLALHTLLTVNKLRNDYKDSLPEDNLPAANDAESAQQDKQLAQANERFENIRKKYTRQLADDGLETVESTIREQLLRTIKSTADTAIPLLGSQISALQS